jgi:hypothetical protein
MTESMNVHSLSRMHYCASIHPCSAYLSSYTADQTTYLFSSATCGVRLRAERLNLPKLNGGYHKSRRPPPSSKTIPSLMKSGNILELNGKTFHFVGQCRPLKI